MASATWTPADFVDTSTYDQPIVIGTTVATDVATQAAQKTSSPTAQNSWTGFFQNMGNTLLGAKVAQQSVQTNTAARVQTAQATAPQKSPVSSGMLMLIGGAVVLMVLLKKAG
jgi:hypothetical protein